MKKSIKTKLMLATPAALLFAMSGASPTAHREAETAKAHRG